MMGTAVTPAACCAPVAAPTLSDEDTSNLAAVFKVLSDPARVRIVNLLANSPEPVCVCEFTAPLGLSQPTVSFHLKKLLNAGMVTREQRGTWAHYSLNRSALERVSGALSQGGMG